MTGLLSPELLLVVGLFSWRIVEANGISRGALLRLGLFLGILAAVIGFAVTPTIREQVFSVSRLGEVQLQLAVCVVLFVVAALCWKLKLVEATRLAVLAAVVAVASNVEPLFIYLVVAAGPRVQREFFRDSIVARWRDWLMLGVAAAGLASLLELLLRGALEMVAGPMNMNLLTALPALRFDDLWILPLANLVLYVPLAALLGIMARVWPSVVGWPAAVFTFACLAISAPALVLMSAASTPFALLVLLWGLAQTVAPAGARLWLTAGRAGRLSRLAVSTATLLLLLTSGSQLARNWQAKTAGNWSSASTTDARPNVLLITLDTVRAKSMSLYGCERRTTPELERWATQGVVFERARPL